MRPASTSTLTCLRTPGSDIDSGIKINVDIYGNINTNADINTNVAITIDVKQCTSRRNTRCTDRCNHCRHYIRHRNANVGGINATSCATSIN